MVLDFPEFPIHFNTVHLSPLGPIYNLLTGQVTYHEIVSSLISHGGVYVIRCGWWPTTIGLPSFSVPPCVSVRQCLQLHLLQ